MLIYFSTFSSAGYKSHKKYQSETFYVKAILLSVIVELKERGINAHIQVKMVQQMG